jgi:hypothetical protein
MDNFKSMLLDLESQYMAVLSAYKADDAIAPLEACHNEVIYSIMDSKILDSVSKKTLLDFIALVHSKCSSQIKIASIYEFLSSTKKD